MLVVALMTSVTRVRVDILVVVALPLCVTRTRMSAMLVAVANSLGLGTHVYVRRLRGWRNTC